MAQPPTVRPIERRDQAAWRPLFDGYNAFYGREGPTALPEEVYATTWDRFFDPGEPVHALVAERDGRMVGIVHYLFHRSTTALGPICYLQDLFTAQDVRGGGIGRALIEAVYAAAKAAGAYRVYWQTHQTNTVAMRLYDQVAEKSGFLVYRKDV
ncbi:MAG: GNAT family N-acetyltransferase [Proteobacteria bacterium]|nr:GNAT family N-acetyltransferase [Pseudomonadota bacterium]